MFDFQLEPVDVKEPYEITHLSNKRDPPIFSVWIVKEPYEITHLSNPPVYGKWHDWNVKEPYEITHLSNAIFRPDTPANLYMGGCFVVFSP